MLIGLCILVSPLFLDPSTSGSSSSSSLLCFRLFSLVYCSTSGVD